MPSINALERLRLENFADDVNIESSMTGWSVARARAYFQEGGQDVEPHAVDDIVAVESARFHLVPGDPGWHAVNEMLIPITCASAAAGWWTGGLPLPTPPVADSWLLPTSDAMAVTVAHWQLQLRAVGWKVLAAPEALVAELGNKAGLRRLAEERGLLPWLPTHYDTPEAACYPCVLKPPHGNFGQGVRIVTRASEVYPQEIDVGVLLQELVKGRREFSASMVVCEGQIYDAVAVEYEFTTDAYVWPRAREVHRRFYHIAPASHLRQIAPFLQTFSGVCNANYKVADDGKLRLFEVNVRVGGDLAVDVPRRRASELISRLDDLQRLHPLDLAAIKRPASETPTAWLDRSRGAAYIETSA